MNTSIEAKPFSDTAKALLIYTKKQDTELGLESVKVCLGEIYHPEMTLDDTIVVTISAAREVIGEPRFQTPSMGHIVPKVVKAPIQGLNSLGDKIFGPKKEEKFTVEEFYNSMIIELLCIFRFANVGWCREYLFPEEKGNN